MLLQWGGPLIARGPARRAAWRELASESLRVRELPSPAACSCSSSSSSPRWPWCCVSRFRAPPGPKAGRWQGGIVSLAAWAPRGAASPILSPPQQGVMRAFLAFLDLLGVGLVRQIQGYLESDRRWLIRVYAMYVLCCPCTVPHVRVRVKKEGPTHRRLGPRLATRSRRRGASVSHVSMLRAHHYAPSRMF